VIQETKPMPDIRFAMTCIPTPQHVREDADGRTKENADLHGVQDQAHQPGRDKRKAVISTVKVANRFQEPRIQMSGRPRSTVTSGL
jgi:hypothetical protein